MMQITTMENESLLLPTEIKSSVLNSLSGVSHDLSSTCTRPSVNPVRDTASSRACLHYNRNMCDWEQTQRRSVRSKPNPAPSGLNISALRPGTHSAPANIHHAAKQCDRREKKHQSGSTPSSRKQSNRNGSGEPTEILITGAFKV